VAHIERRVRNGKTTYRARYRDPGGREHAKVFARKADAQRFLTEMENSKLRGAWTNPALGRVLFREWFGEWRRTTARLQPNTEARDERLFRLHMLPHFGPMALARIGQRDVRAWVAGLTGKGLAASTVQRCYQLLSKVMAAAVDAGMSRRRRAGGCHCPGLSARRCGSSPPLRSGSWPTRLGRSTGR
jgi:Phage integrase, N-terminal SAM-like domain